ncbi:dienelactone hydrolase [Kushneria sinocarnis]|uniref:Dienelactone hydrolase n=1 Tax=Kushneria sinocarnis TaxID=595502 RepID=A0A420WX46_9GAMM|nr:dienelactone hydrolase family protein [Kushneria sinocarnis]RKR04319.1 dienelactone hydrolase [Kushneria sinocarnis]
MRAMVFGFGMLMASVSTYGAEQGQGMPGDIGPDVQGQQVTYTVDDQQYSGYLARDVSAEGKRPGVLIVHEWWGQTDYIRQRARKLAALGYVAFAVDMYGEGRTADHPDDAGSFSSDVMQDWPAAERNLGVAMATLKSQDGVDPERLAAIGYCFGGAVVLNAALAGMPLDAVVSFHGSPAQVVETPKHFDGRVLIQNGQDDQMVKPEALQSLVDAFQKVDTSVTVIQYPHAQHAFTNPYVDAKAEQFDLPLAYSPAADAASWQVMLNLFDQVFARTSKGSKSQ